jgi:DNA helicase-2/ATP-dependent DNA helicase PcrA
VALAGIMGEMKEIGEIGVAGLVEAVARLLGERTGLSDADEARLKRLQRRAVLFGDDLDRFLEAAALQAETDDYDPRADRVALMTLHAAKGLEFPVVFMVGCEEGLLPYVRTGKVTDTDEERRLFYVGMTRAREKLILTSARRRFLFGQAMENEPSRFVGDIEQALKVVQEGEWRKAKAKPDPVQLSLF